MQLRSFTLQNTRFEIDRPHGGQKYASRQLLLSHQNHD